VRSPALPLRCFLAAVAATTVGACGSTPHKDAAIAERLDRPGTTWAKLSPVQQREALSTCRLGEAVAVAREGGATSAPYYSSRFATVMAVPGARLHQRLDAWFADGAHATQTVREGCTAVVAGLVDLPALRRRAHADFASPVRVTRDALRLMVDGDSALLRARVSPAGARLVLSSAPGRARTTATWTMREQDGVTVVDLRRMPRGTSYLGIRVGSWRRVMIIHQAPARRLPPPRTFAPIALRGQGEVGLRLLYVPQPAEVSARIDGAPLTLTTGRTLLLALGPGDGPEPVPLRPGRYRDVQVRTPGAWSIRIVPQR
jgi:hypothetical protein